MDLATGDIEFMGEHCRWYTKFSAAPELKPTLEVTVLESAGIIVVDPRNQTIKRMPATRLRQTCRYSVSVQIQFRR